MLQGPALDWYMKFFIVPVGVVPKTLNEIQIRLIDGFKKSNSESQCITEIKEIKHLLPKFVWDFEQRFKTLMDKVSIQMLDVQHKEWFIATLLPHIRTTLMHQKVVLQTEALEIAMKLESSPIGDTDTGMMQIQLYMAIFMVHIQDIKRGKEVQEELWCTRCRTYMHDKDNFSTLMNYTTKRVSNPINTQGMPW